MKLLECYIENFGKISKKKFSFKDGLNCITEDNGSGKTTLAAFIKVMLYGMSDTKKLNLEENDRRHYLPWQGGVCGGSLTFLAGGKTYRVERTFAPKAADDSYALYDTATGRACTDFPEGLGEGLFGIDADGFERTVFLSERALTPSSDNKSISAKLSDLVGCDGDIGGMDEALKILEEKRKFYYKKGGSGEIADTKAKIDLITRRLDTLSDTERAAEENRLKMLDLARRIDAARVEAKDLITRRGDAARLAAETSYEKQYKEIKLSLEGSERRRIEVAAIFGENIPSHSEIDEASYKSIEAKNLVISTQTTSQNQELKMLSDRFDGKVDRAKIDEIRSAIEILNAKKTAEDDPRLSRAKRIFAKRTPTEDEIDATEGILKQGKKKSPIGCIIAYALFILCCAFGAFFEQVLIAVGVIGFACTVVADALIKAGANRKKRQKINDFFLSVTGVEVDSDDEARTRLSDMRELLSIMNSGDNGPQKEALIEKIRMTVQLFPDLSDSDPIRAAEEIVARYDRYTELALTERYMMTDRTERMERAERLRGEAEAFIRRFNTKSSDPFTELRSALNEYSRLCGDIAAKREEMARLESLNSIGEGNQKKAKADIESIDRRRLELDELIANLSREYALTERSYNAQAEELDSREELMMRKAELEELYQKHTENYDTVLLTKKYLAEAKDNMTFKYLGKTKAGFIKYAERIGEITGESFEMDTDFSVTKQEGATTRTVEAYSRGTRDLYNLAARLALVDSLYEAESPFILLDDPFTAFDDKKTAAALKLLTELAKQRQIIYFTCARSRSV